MITVTLVLNVSLRNFDDDEWRSRSCWEPLKDLFPGDRSHRKHLRILLTKAKLRLSVVEG